MRLLVMHPNFPAQFLYLAHYLRQMPDNQVVFITANEENSMQNVHKVLFKPAREPSPDTHHYLTSMEEAVLQGQAVADLAFQLKAQGFRPDVIIGHSGWGCTMYMKDVFPDVPLVCYFEWFYRAHGSDCDFGGAVVTAEAETRIRMKNAPILIDLYSCDRGISPTYWQHSQFPAEYATKIKVIHDGVDTGFCRPQPGAKLVLPDKNLDLSQVDEIVTYVGRGFEPYRGFPQFMAAIRILLKRRPHCHVVIVGEDRVCYGSKLKDGKTYKEAMLEELPDLDTARVHFTGYLPKDQYMQVLQASKVHVYLTMPFVLSWSMLEAMACGCCIVASNTQPVMEVINDGVNGLLADFFSPGQIAGRIEEALSHRRWREGIGSRARETILDRYDVRRTLPRYLEWLFNK
ncbi:MAG TPA: glycosyltransferase family 4 protein [Methylomusa anaerophila]|uniref:D-inositol-3-phosphate glycosyltransferase n=1 Tax=Methylomusa anaerophila TaxID=1930071 RepID=A0A348AKQ7_9FIRM|nr:glycosyltransferase family 4 protein [Methylomusa anaerophila]BBB91655.1 D-inositol-3-phosphate glycosyltransferase [Methylomusa anaerophila]HML88611.1 glycosyltransferase family 4 protein [Methylomusa anaerophila]